MTGSSLFSCPEKGCAHTPLTVCANGLCCPNGHTFPYVNGTQIPVFVCAPENSSDYTQANATQIHDNSLRWLFETFNTNEANLRDNLVARLKLKKGDSVLVTGAGTGNDLPFLVQHMEGEGTIHAQDISYQMLLTGAERHGAQLSSPGLNLCFSVSDATDLPYADNIFDAAYHFGGINLFPDIRRGIAEMNRVVKPGGRIVIGDEGLAPWLKSTELGKMLVKNNPLYVYEAPLSLLPDTARQVRLSWVLHNCFYVLEFTVADSPLPINIDVPHVGKRGGSIRTRYFGELEGVDPALRDAVYAAAEKQGISRVAYLEQLLRKQL